MASLLATASMVPLQGSQSYMGALQTPSDMRGKTVEEVWSSLATVDPSTASAATSEPQLKPRDSANLLEVRRAASAEMPRALYSLQITALQSRLSATLNWLMGAAATAGPGACCTAEEQRKARGTDILEGNETTR
jgi:hypothetical protein